MPLKFQKQKHHHRPPGEIGDCYRTCLAILTGRDRDEVPHFVEDAWRAAGHDDPEGFWSLLRKWLGAMGLHRIAFGWKVDKDCTMQEALDLAKHWTGTMCYMLAGVSRSGTAHVVICKGDRVIWDPSLNASGIIGPMEEDGVWVYQIEFFVMAPYDRFEPVVFGQVASKDLLIEDQSPDEEECLRMASALEAQWVERDITEGETISGRGVMAEEADHYYSRSEEAWDGD